MSDYDGIQMSFRLPAELHLPCKQAAENDGQTLAEWIRRAMREKLERETGAEPSAAGQITREEIRSMIREELGTKASFTITPSKKVQKQRL